ncbi:MAG: tetratricopeptide repeat protein, partial [Planctomycetota bacterium]
LHAANAALAYALLLALFRRAIPQDRLPREGAFRLAAAAGALSFAVHPLRVESVAWITERRDLLSAFFALLALLAYLRMQEAPAARWRVLSLLALALSLLSKAWAVTLPAILLVLDVWPLRRFAGKEPRGRVLLEKVPYLVLALACAAIAPLAQKEAEAMRPLASHTLLDRTAQAAYGLVFYARKTLLPLGLSPLYELGDSLDAREPRFVASALLLGAAGFALIRGRRRWPAGLSAAACYAIAVSPVLGFLQSGPQLVADRYSYLSCLPFAALAAAGALRLGSRAPLASVGAAGLSLAVLAALAARQTRVWKDSVSLWEHATAVEPTSPISQANLGTSYDEAGRLSDAIARYRATLELRPGDQKTRHSLALAHAKRGEYEAAIGEWKRLLELQPRHAEALYSLGLASFRLGRVEDAVEFYRKATEVDPAYSTARHALAEAYSKQARTAEAIAEWERVLASDPGHAGARNGLGLAHLAAGRLPQAEEQFRAALRAKPDDADSWNNLGAALSRSNREAEALECFRRALAADPDHPLARENLRRMPGEAR